MYLPNKFIEIQAANIFCNQIFKMYFKKYGIENNFILISF